MEETLAKFEDESLGPKYKVIDLKNRRDLTHLGSDNNFVYFTPSKNEFETFNVMSGSEANTFTNTRDAKAVKVYTPSNNKFYLFAYADGHVELRGMTNINNILEEFDDLGVVKEIVSDGGTFFITSDTKGKVEYVPITCFKEFNKSEEDAEEEEEEGAGKSSLDVLAKKKKKKPVVRVVMQKEGVGKG